MADEKDDAEAALRPVGGVQEIQVVGALADHIALAMGLNTPTRSVWLHPDVVSHIQNQRSQNDAAFCLEHLTSVILRPDLVGPDPRDERRRHLVKTVADRVVFVAIKHVTATEAKSQTDEIWVSTSYAMGPTALTRKRWNSTLAEVKWEDED